MKSCLSLTSTVYVLDHYQITALVEKHAPDVIGLCKKSRCIDDAFPHEIPQSVGYHAYYFGQKSHYGVAIFSKQEATNVEYGFPDDEEDAQRRMIIATFDTPQGPVKVMFGYFLKEKAATTKLSFQRSVNFMQT